jgi:hypothetical protein
MADQETTAPRMPRPMHERLGTLEREVTELKRRVAQLERAGRRDVSTTKGEPDE